MGRWVALVDGCSIRDRAIQLSQFGNRSLCRNCPAGPQPGVTQFSAAAEAWADGRLDTAIGINGPLVRYAVGRMRVASHRLASVTTAARMPTVPK